MINNENKEHRRKSLFLSIIIPLCNEEENVDVLYDEIRESVDPLRKSYEIIFVDDGSVDGTLGRLQAIIKENKQDQSQLVDIRIMRFSRNFGQAAATQAGFDHAKGEIIVSMDADLQNDPADIPKLLAKLNEGYDLACGWRRDRKDRILTRVIPSQIANWLIRKITGVNIHDIGCSMKAYRKHLLKTLTLYSDMHRFIPALTTLAGIRMAEIVVNHRPRKHGITKYGLSRTWKVFFDLITLEMLVHFQDRPLRWFAIFSLLFCALGFVLGTASIVSLFEGRQSIVLPAACFLFFFLAGSLISWGLLAEFFVNIEKR